MSQTNHPSRLAIDKLLLDCSVERTKRGGPGGQHRNKVESAIVITHRPTGIVGQASERRSQHENRDVAVDRLRLNLAVGFRTNLDLDKPPSDLWRSRRKGSRISVSQSHSDFAPILAEALDFVAANEFEMSESGKSLGVSSSQLVKLFKSYHPAIEFVNHEREKRGLGKLR